MSKATDRVVFKWLIMTCSIRATVLFLMFEWHILSRTLFKKVTEIINCQPLTIKDGTFSFNDCYMEICHFIETCLYTGE